MQFTLIFNKLIKNRVVMWTCTIVVLNIIFGLYHVPLNMHFGNVDFLQALLNTRYQMAYGIIFSLFYLRTGNIFLTMFYHAYTNLYLLHILQPLTSRNYTLHMIEALLFFIIMMIFGNKFELLLSKKNKFIHE